MSVATRAPAVDRPSHASASSEPPTAGDGDPAPARPGFRMPHGLASGRFALTVGLLLAVGLVSLLAINTSLAAGAITLGGLESSLARKTEERQALHVAVEGLSSPAALQQTAIALGMVPAAVPAFLDPATGVVSGELTAAVAPPEPPVPAPQVILPPPPPPPPPTPSAGPGPSSGAARPSPTPSAPVTAPLPVDPGADGAVLSRTEVIPDAASLATPAPVTSGDSASVVGMEAD